MTEPKSSLIVGMNAGLMLNRRNPMPKSTSTERGWPAISPQSVTGVPVRWQASRTMRNTRKIAGASDSHRCATLGLSRSAATRYWIRSFEPIEMKSVSRKKGVDANRRRGHLDHHASLDILAERHPLALKIAPRLLNQVVDVQQLFERRDHRKQHRDFTVAARAKSPALA